MEAELARATDEGMPEKRDGDLEWDGLENCSRCDLPATTDEMFTVTGEIRVCPDLDCVQGAFDDQAACVKQLRSEVAKLQGFKDYVHRRLDEAGVPTHPEGQHAAEGCRIGERLDLVFGERDRLRGALRRWIVRFGAGLDPVQEKEWLREYAVGDVAENACGEAAE